MNCAEFVPQRSLMGNGLHVCNTPCRRCLRLLLLSLTVALLSPINMYSQTASTGALTGQTLDPSGAILPAVSVRLARLDGTVKMAVSSDENGLFGFFLLPPGTYEVQASKVDFKPVHQTDIHVYVTETLRLQLHFELATREEKTRVVSEPLMVQLDTSALGRAVDRETVSRLPLVTRNFAQITGLSPGVAVGVYNAGELGTGATALSQIGKSNDGMFVHGARSYDNNWQLDGISVSDVQGSGSISGGIPIPNPDTLEEFKVQTGLGADGIATAFGNSATGIVTGPGQANLNLSFLKTMVLNCPVEKCSLQFRVEFYNALNHPQFANPDTNFTSPTFGVISSTAVNARAGQLALKFAF